MGWIVPQLLDRLEGVQDLYFDEVSQIELPEWYSGRVAFVGDACQCVSLLAGQGASLAMAGAFLLAHEIDASPGEPTAALARYEGRLKPLIGQKQKAGRRMAKWFVPTSDLLIAVRDLVLRMSSWPLASWLLRRQIAAESVL
jgi:2-polyprenyl-6-methoxyphenol hydroxylase-like FAD-dependent oxidoreductase